MNLEMNLVSALAHILELIIVFQFFSELFNGKGKKIVAAAVGFVFYAAACAAYLLFDKTLLNIVFCFVINAVSAKLFFDCKAKGALLGSLFISVSDTAADFIVVTVLGIVGGDIKTYRSSVYAYLLMVLLSKSVLFVLTKAAVYAGLYLRDKRDARIPAFLLIYPVASIAILYTFWIISVRYDLSRNISIAISVAAVAIIISAFLTFVFYGRTSRRIDELHETQREAELLRIDQTYYTLLDRQNEMLKTITHDEKNHLIAIKALANDPAVSEYIDNIYDDIKCHSMFGNTKNKFLDLLLNKYESVCLSAGISFEYSINTANLSFMDAPDLITLLSNILDNAVEAAGASEGKKIELSISRVNAFDMLTCVNSCDSKPQSVGKKLRTSKNSDGFHGLGTKSIRTVVAKYKGEFDWSYSEFDRKFTVKIAFSRTDKESANG